MKRDFDIPKKYPSLFRHDLLLWRLRSKGWSKKRLSEETDVAYGTVRKALNGRATNRVIWPIAKKLNLNWAMLHDLKLKEEEFHLAVNGAKAR